MEDNSTGLINKKNDSYEKFFGKNPSHPYKSTNLKKGYWSLTLVRAVIYTREDGNPQQFLKLEFESDFYGHLPLTDTKGIYNEREEEKLLNILSQDITGKNFKELETYKDRTENGNGVERECLVLKGLEGRIFVKVGEVKNKYHGRLMTFINIESFQKIL